MGLRLDDGRRAQDLGDSPKLYRSSTGKDVIGIGQKSGDYHVLDRETGELLHSTHHLQQANSLGGFQNGGAYSDGRVFQHGLNGLDQTGSGPFDASLLALSRSGRRVLWRFDRSGSGFIGNLAVANGVVYLVSTVEEAPGEPPASALYALDADTGEVLLRDASLPRAISSPVVSRGRVLVGFGNAAVDALGVDTAGGLICFSPAPDL
jgi:polyvinyl alcohol dehydrogenase (cytochrome)